MADIKCSEPGCPYWISDPCVKVSALFSLKLSLDAQPDVNAGEIDNINKTLENDLGLSDHQRLYMDYKTNIATNRQPEISQPILFTLLCPAGHRLQYSLTCN